VLWLFHLFTPFDLTTFEISDKLIAALYERMPHAATRMAGVEWRSLDGSDNLGKAGMPYGRSVISERIKKEYPDSDEVFRKLLQRRRSPEGIEYVSHTNL